MNIEIQTTSDGTPTLYRADIDEHYHSIKGALAESLHIYIDLGWRRVAQKHGNITVFEVGFGTGLNALLTAKAAADAGIHTTYYTVELYPLSTQTIDSLLKYQPEQYRDLFKTVNNAEWDTAIEINPYFTIVKLKDNLLTMEIPTHPDVVYFDAFAPEKQPEMWNEQVFQKIYNAMPPGAVLTTYCSKGAIRRMLEKIGFTTERLQGPPNGKREVLRAQKS